MTLVEENSATQYRRKMENQEDIDDSFIENFEKNAENLDLQKANQIIAGYFPKNNFQFVLVGKTAGTLLALYLLDAKKKKNEFQFNLAEFFKF